MKTYVSKAPEFRKALRAAMLARPELVALVGDRIYDDPPQNDIVRPWIRIGEDTLTPEEATGYEGENAYIDIHVWSNKAGKYENAEIRREVCKAIYSMDIDIGDLAVVDVNITVSRCFTDANGRDQHGIISVKGFLE